MYVLNIVNIYTAIAHSHMTVFMSIIVALWSQNYGILCTSLYPYILDFFVCFKLFAINIVEQLFHKIVPSSSANIQRCNNTHIKSKREKKIQNNNSYNLNIVQNVQCSQFHRTHKFNYGNLSFLLLRYIYVMSDRLNRIQSTISSFYLFSCAYFPTNKMQYGKPFCFTAITKTDSLILNRTKNNTN